MSRLTVIFGSFYLLEFLLPLPSRVCSLMVLVKFMFVFKFWNNFCVLMLEDLVELRRERLYYDVCFFVVFGLNVMFTPFFHSRLSFLCFSAYQRSVIRKFFCLLLGLNSAVKKNNHVFCIELAYKAYPLTIFLNKENQQ